MVPITPIMRTHNISAKENDELILREALDKIDAQLASITALRTWSEEQAIRSKYHSPFTSIDLYTRYSIERFATIKTQLNDQLSKLLSPSSESNDLK